MNLEEFVTATIKQIVAGVRASQDEESGALVNPALPDVPARGNDPIVHLASGRWVALTRVEFDVAITVSTEVGGMAEVKGKLFVASAGGTVDGSHEQTRVSRVKFTVPVTLPGQIDAKREKEKAESAARAETMLTEASQGDF